MENIALTEKWPQIKEQLLNENPYLKAEELVCEIGKERELLLELQEKRRVNKIQIDNVLSTMG